MASEPEKPIDPAPRIAPYRYLPGVSGNPGGKTKAQKAMERDNAMIALKVRHKFLVALQAVVSEHVIEQDDGSILIIDALALAPMVTDTTLRLLKDAEERGFGKPVQPIDLPVTERQQRDRAAHLLAGAGLDPSEVEAILGGDNAIPQQP